MPALSQEGAVMKAQLAAYRRTLAATFGHAASSSRTSSPATTPAVARDAGPGDRLGDGARPAARVEGVMARTARRLARAHAAPPTRRRGTRAGCPATRTRPRPPMARATRPPAPRHPPRRSTTPAAMFAGIEAIGSERRRGPPPLILGLQGGCRPRAGAPRAATRRPGPVEGHAPVPERDPRVVADHHVVEDVDVEQAARPRSPRR